MRSTNSDEDMMSDVKVQLVKQYQIYINNTNPFHHSKIKFAKTYQLLLAGHNFEVKQVLHSMMFMEAIEIQ